jgi:hypothetical protein
VHTPCKYIIPAKIAPLCAATMHILSPTRSLWTAAASTLEGADASNKPNRFDVVGKASPVRVQ